MKEYITKAKVIEAIEKAVAPEITTIGDYETIGVFTRESIERIVSNLTAADVPEVRHGRWKNGICTDCGFDIRCLTDGENDLEEWVWEGLDYCPNCGARMDKEDEHGTD